MTMTPSKQVSSSHYEFRRYLSKWRWSSMWHQIDEILSLKPDTVLEIGPGPGVFKQVAAAFGLRIETLDVDADLAPDHVGSATELPFADGAFDVVCAFQVLEHLPFDQSLKAFAEMIRVSRRNVVISLPDVEPVWRYEFHVPKLGARSITLRKPFFQMRPHEFDGQHYWEINKKDYDLARVTKELEKFGRLLRTYRVPDNTYHRFFVFQKTELTTPASR